MREREREREGDRERKIEKDREGEEKRKIMATIIIDKNELDTLVCESNAHVYQAIRKVIATSYLREKEGNISYLTLNCLGPQSLQT